MKELLKVAADLIYIQTLSVMMNNQFDHSVLCAAYETFILQMGGLDVGSMMA